MSDKLILAFLEQGLNKVASANRDDSDWESAKLYTALEGEDLVGAYFRQSDIEWQRTSLAVHDYMLELLSGKGVALSLQSQTRLAGLYVEYLGGMTQDYTVRALLSCDLVSNQLETYLMLLVTAIQKKSKPPNSNRELAELVGMIIESHASNSFEALKQLLEDEKRRLNIQGPMSKQTARRAHQFGGDLETDIMKLIP